MIGIASVAGAPGVTALTMALSYTWADSTLIVEADISRASAILGGWYQGSEPATRGLIELAIKASHGPLQPEHFWEEVLQMDDRQYVLPGLLDPASATSVTPSLWAGLAAWTNSLASGGLTTLVDLGRLAPDDARATLISSLRRLIVVCPSTLPDILAVHQALPFIRAMLPTGMADTAVGLVLATVPGITNYTGREVREHLQLPVWATIPHDRAAAMRFTHHTRPVPSKDGSKAHQRAIRRSKLTRAAHSLSQALTKQITDEDATVLRQEVRA